MALWILAAALVTIPVLLAMRLHENGLEVAPQNTIDPVSVSAGETAHWRSLGARLPGYAAPVVIAYHDVRAIGDGDEHPPGAATCCGGYTVTPQALDRQLTMLQAAGYRTLSAEQYVAFVRGAPLPRRSVLITFNGTRQGQWTFADEILARHHMRAVSFLRPRAIASHWSRYLSWAEVKRMQGSGRWDFEAAVSRTALSAPSGAGAIPRDLQAAVEAIRDHDLPVPTLFSLPLAARGTQPDLADSVDAARFVRAPFVAAFAGSEEQAPPTSRRAAAGKVMGRIEVARSDGPDQLLAAVAGQTALPPERAAPLSSPAAWTADGGGGAPLTISGPTIRFTGGGERESVTYADDATADWDSYIVDAEVRGLSDSADAAASVFVRVGSRQSLMLRVTARSMSVLALGGLAPRIVHQSRLQPGADHHVRVIVSGVQTLFTVDGVVTFAVRGSGGLTAAGGIGLAARRANPRRSWPTFVRLRVAPITAGTVSADSASPISPRSSSPLDRPWLWLRNPFTPAAVVATPSTVRFTGPGRHAFATYAPLETARWSRYAFSATAENLAPGTSADLYTLAHSRHEAVAVVGQHEIKIFAGPDGRRRLLLAKRIPPRTAHRVVVDVGSGAAAISVDGASIASVPLAAGLSGGIGVGATRGRRQGWPRLVSMKVTGP